MARDPQAANRNGVQFEFYLPSQLKLTHSKRTVPLKLVNKVQGAHIQRLVRPVRPLVRTGERSLKFGSVGTAFVCE
jgi:hypothetical protein